MIEKEKFRHDEFLENGKKRWSVINNTYRYTVAIVFSKHEAKRIAHLLSKYGDRDE